MIRETLQKETNLVGRFFYNSGVTKMLKLDEDLTAIYYFSYKRNGTKIALYWICNHVLIIL